MLYMWKLMVYGVNSRRENIDFGLFISDTRMGGCSFSFSFFLLCPHTV